MPNVILAVDSSLWERLTKYKSGLKAKFVEDVKTAPLYQLWSIQGKFPAMTRGLGKGEEGSSLNVQLWECAYEDLAVVNQGDTQGLCLGRVELDDEQRVLGVLAEPFLIAGQKEITGFGDWKSYLAHQETAGEDSGATVAIPSAKPYTLHLPKDRTAIVLIDFQRDFLLPGGFGGSLGNNLALLQKCIAPAKKLLAACREHGLVVVHTLESHERDLSDCPPAKRTRGNPKIKIGDQGGMGRILIRGEYGNDLIDELAAKEGEKLIYKPGKGAFFATDLHNYLQSKGVTHILFCGVTTEVCVQTSMREANDRGYDSCMVEDATESYFAEYKKSTLEMVRAQNGIVGWTAETEAIVEALEEGGKKS